MSLAGGRRYGVCPSPSRTSQNQERYGVCPSFLAVVRCMSLTAERYGVCPSLVGGTVFVPRPSRCTVFVPGAETKSKNIRRYGVCPSPKAKAIRGGTVFVPRPPAVRCLSLAGLPSGTASVPHLAFAPSFCLEKFCGSDNALEALSLGLRGFAARALPDPLLARPFRFVAYTWPLPFVGRETNGKGRATFLNIGFP